MEEALLDVRSCPFFNCHYHQCKSSLRSISNIIDIVQHNRWKVPGKIFSKELRRVSAIRHIFSIWRKVAYLKRLFFWHHLISVLRYHVLADPFSGSKNVLAHQVIHDLWAIFLRDLQTCKIQLLVLESESFCFLSCP